MFLTEEQAAIQISTTHYLRTFKEFQTEIKKHTSDDFYFKNWTEQDHAGWTDALYQAQDGFLVIEYIQTRMWRFHFNGVIGEGLTLEDAINNHKVKYDEHTR